MDTEPTFFLRDGGFYDSEGNEVSLKVVMDSGGVVYTQDGEEFVP